MGLNGWCIVFFAHYIHVCLMDDSCLTEHTVTPPQSPTVYKAPRVHSCRGFVLNLVFHIEWECSDEERGR